MLIWIGGLKVAQHMNAEDALVPANREWHDASGTYPFALALGALGDTVHGFPYLSGRGRLVVKDVIMMGAALVTMADSAKLYLNRRAD